MFKARPITAKVTNLIKAGLRKAGISVCDPAEMGISDDDYYFVCQANTSALINAKIMLAVMTDPSTGLGAELHLRKVTHREICSVFIKGERLPAWGAYLGGYQWWLQRNKLEVSVRDVVAAIKMRLRDE